MDQPTQVNEKPVVEHDHYRIDPEKKKSLAKMVGERVLRFGNFKTEHERIEVGSGGL